MLTNFDHHRQWFNTLIPPSHESAAVTVDCISLLSGPVRLILRYTTVDIHFRDRRYDCRKIVLRFFENPAAGRSPISVVLKMQENVKANAVEHLQTYL